MSGNYGTVTYEEPGPDEFVKEELMLHDHYGNEGDISFNQPVNDVDQLEHEGELSSFKMNDEEEECEVKPFESVFLREEDIGVLHFQSNDSDPLTIPKEDGIENEVDFKIQAEDTLLADNGDAVCKEHGKTYPTCSMKDIHSKSQEESVVFENCVQNNHHNMASRVSTVSENRVNGKCPCKSINKKNTVKTTTSVKKIQCTYCEYKCSRKTNLKNHIMIHTVEKPFQCCYCKYKCSLKQTFKVHMLTHTAEKSFQCSYCEYRCSKKEQLKRHVMTHTGDKPFQCSLCQYRCSRKDNLKSHLLTHTAPKSKKPFQCSYCEYTCYIKGNLKLHLLTHI